MPTAMRIAINCRLLVAGKMDGIGWFTYETTRRLVAAHPEHSFILLFDRKVDAQFRFADNAQEVQLFPPARHPVLWWTYFEGAVRWALRHYHADLLLSPDGFLPLRCPVPTVSVIHDINFEHALGNMRPSHQRYMQHYFPRFAREATRVVTVSQFSKNDIAHTYSIDENKIDVSCNGAGEHYRPHSEAEQAATRQRYTAGRPYLLFVSTILRRKNLANLLTAFDRVKDMDGEDLQLIVVGNRAWWADELAAAYDAMRHADAVHFLGHLSQEELSAVMSAARALVYPSFFEGFGIPILEAMYAEVPVICSRTTSMPEVGGDAVLYIDPFDVPSIAHAIRQMESDALRQTLIEKGRRQRTRYSWDIAAERLWASIMKVANGA